MKTKRCPHCGKTKLLSEFHKNRTSPDGHMSWCRACHNEDERQRRANYAQGINRITKTTKRCPHCRETKPAGEFHKNKNSQDGLTTWCKTCRNEKRRERQRINPERERKIRRESNYRLGKCQPLGTNPNCPAYLGVHIAERVLANVFEHVERMPFGHPGFDFICKKGYKIDVKSSTRLRHQPNMWNFAIRKNTTPDYFLCLAFDNLESLNPEHIWLLPGDLVNDHAGAAISESTLSKWSEYELHDKLEKVVACCDTIRDTDQARST